MVRFDEPPLVDDTEGVTGRSCRHHVHHVPVSPLGQRRDSTLLSLYPQLVILVELVGGEA